MAKKYEELKFNDDFMFCKILEQRPALCRELLELVLDRKVGALTGVNPQKPIEIIANGKGVRFDVYAEGSDSVIYEIEMQNASVDSIAKRSRYSQGMIDLNLIERGAHYSELNRSYVSFSEIESPSLLFRRGSLSLLRKRKSNLIRIQQARCPSRRKDSGGPPVKGRLSW